MISVCMIARNEAEIIGAAIASTAGLADEIIVVDTGSTDDTVDVAINAGAHVQPHMAVIEGGDYRNLGGSRNQAIREAMGDWIVILDADETIADPTGVREFLENTTAQAVYIRETYMQGDKPGLAFSQMRCWRRGTYEYLYRCHEVPTPLNGWGEIAHTEFVWEHRPPPRPDKSHFYLMLLLMDAEENPGDARVLYYLARQWMYCAAYHKAIELSKKFLEVAPPAFTDREWAYTNMAECYVAIGDTENALENRWRAVQTRPTQRSQWGRLPEAYHAKEQHELAAGMLKLALTLPPDEQYQDPRWIGPHIYDLLARCLWYGGKRAEGREYAERALALAPDDERLIRNLSFFEVTNDGPTNT